MNPFTSRIPPRPHLLKDKWLIPVTLMCLVLGFMIALAWVTPANQTSRYANLSSSQKPRVSEASVDIEAFQTMKQQVTDLQKEKTKLENALAGQDGKTKVLNDSLQDTKAFAGLVAVEGPGVSVTLRDSTKKFPELQNAGGGAILNETNVHDTDALLIVNELFNAGAEAVAVDKERVVGVSNIRCAGTIIMVNDVKVAPPIVIRAIGDPNTLIGALNINGGIVSDLRMTDPNMVEIAPLKKMVIPAYTGKTKFRLATPVKEDK